MLSLTDISNELETFHSTQYKPAIKKLYELVKTELVDEKIVAKKNILDCNKKRVFFVDNNILKLFAEKKLIKLYSENDAIFCGYSTNKSIEIFSEFNCTIKTLYIEKIEKNNNYIKILNLISEIQSMESSINLQIAANLKQAEIIDASYFKHFEKNDIIIKEGDNSEEIFEMIIGSANVIKNNEIVGKVETEEVFGEISFLSSTPRNATVIANGNCTVRVIPKAEFSQLIKQRPRFIIHIASVLAKRFNNIIEEK